MSRGTVAGWVAVGLCAALDPIAPAAEPETGFQAEARVKRPTRLDWAFVASAFGADAAKLPAGYDSTRQRYQLYVPPAYDATKTWPLVVFISPGDDPLGWRAWQKVCEDEKLIFCAAYGAGNNCPVGRRVRIVLDMLDDVRRAYRVDPDRTYLTGFSGGGRMACSIAFHLPEFFGGVVPVGGTNPLPKLDYLRHRVRDRLSVAFVTGEKDFNRAENEAFMAPVCEAVEVRTKLWVVPKLGHALPPTEVTAEVHHWLSDDLKRRRQDAKDRPKLAVADDEVPTDAQAARRLLETANDELGRAETTFRGVAKLRGVVARYADTDAGKEAAKRLIEVAEDPTRMRRVAEQGGAEERTLLTAQGKGLEKMGQSRGALQAFEQVARNHPDTAEGKRAAEEAKRLRGELARTPYLGVSFDGTTLVVQDVVRKGPAEQAGLERGDKVTKASGKAVASLAEFRAVLAAVKPGDRLALEIDRAGKSRTVTVEVGSQADASP